MKDVNFKFIAEKIQHYRKNQNLTVEALAERIGITAQHLSHILNCHSKLSLTCLVNVCLALNVSPNDLLIDNITNDSVKPELNKQVSGIFQDLSAFETRHLLAICKSAKQSLRTAKEIIE